MTHAPDCDYHCEQRDEDCTCMTSRYDRCREAVGPDIVIVRPRYIAGTPDTKHPVELAVHRDGREVIAVPLDHELAKLLYLQLQRVWL